jgi:two-component system, cell cycle sensor histidine kinase and response regulator CckA
MRWQGACLQLFDMKTQPETLLGKKILLVEDDRSFRETLGRLLRLDDHTVTEANNGAEGLGLFSPDQFDVVVTDYMLPFLKGTELSARIKQLAPAQPILMITGFGMRPGRHTRVDWVLRKPFLLGELRFALVKVMRSRNSHQRVPNDTGTKFYQRLPRAAA